MKTFKKMKVINPNSAGIDIGSRSHFVAVGQQEDQVKEFSVYHSGTLAIVDYLNQHEVTTVAMESTGSYWQSLFHTLQESGFEVILVQGTQTKNLKAKTDVKDAQWIQKLHQLGLLRGSFLPCSSTIELRTLTRHRSSLIEQSSKYTNKMQKALRLMNFRLDVAVSDITGKSGIRIIEAILDGVQDSNVLSQLCDKRVKKSRDEVSDALKGKRDNSLMYELRDCYDMYKIYQEKIHEVEQEIEKVLQQHTKEIQISDEQKSQLVKKQIKGKNQPRIAVQEYSYKLFGTDIMAIESVSVSTVLSFLSEIGLDIYKFDSAKKFTNWLRLAPNNRISGGKIISSRTPKGKNKFALALRNAANTIERKKEGYLVQFFKRIAYKKGRGAAITATARKIAVLIWNMIIKKQAYTPIASEKYKEKLKHIKTKQIQKLMKKHKISIDSLSAF